MTWLSDAFIIAYDYALTKPFRYGFRPYVKACIILFMAKSGSTATKLAN